MYLERMTMSKNYKRNPLKHFQKRTRKKYKSFTVKMILVVKPQGLKTQFLYEIRKAHPKRKYKNDI